MVSEDSSSYQSRLSLSLGSVPFGERVMNPASYLIAMKEEGCGMGFDGFPSINQSWCGDGNPNQSFVASIGSSKYLQPAQSLLQEMVSVGGDGVHASNRRCMDRLGRRVAFRVSCKLKAELSSCELVCVNLLKLIGLLEEVEMRYEEYSHHMDDLIYSFEAIAGTGAGKSYTALALQAMSKHLCRLRNAILAQIHTTKHKLLKDTPKTTSRRSQLSLLDQEARPIHAWRPLRGLPETCVAILRAWLFKHFLHPYPNDSEKLMLASQTGLSKNQVSSWFINARVRLWKPMIEEMYKEEFEDSSTESHATYSNFTRSI
ncbi:BEL1-like homeodomain protein 11 [Salvia divinorum]|uniref:BEL1-like homeodomain protein 11 n=1 Tax=Salvia divinorum TaxID=28513 RepID=A0ABD1HX80_SALDI